MRRPAIGASCLCQSCVTSHERTVHASLCLFPLHRDWQACITAFLAHVYSISNSSHTVTTYQNVLKSFFADCLRAPDAYTRADVEAYLASPTRAKWRHGTPPSACTRHVRLVALSSFYKFAENWIILVDGNRQRLLQSPPPTTGVTYGKRPNHHQALSSDELKRLFAVIPTDTTTGLRDRALFLTFFWTARRKSEIARLCYGDLEARILTANGTRYAATVYRFKNKGNGAVYEYAELPAPAATAIDRYLTVSGRKATIQASDPLFALSPSGMTYILKKYLALAGLPAHFSLHSLRHSGARIRYEQGQDIRSIQQLLRHSSLQATDIYLRTLIGVADSGAKLLEATYGTL